MEWASKELLAFYEGYLRQNFVMISTGPRHLINYPNFCALAFREMHSASKDTLFFVLRVALLVCSYNRTSTETPDAYRR